MSAKLQEATINQLRAGDCLERNEGLILAKNLEQAGCLVAEKIQRYSERKFSLKDKQVSLFFY